jgi:serine/threonine-protein kinase
MSSHEERDDLGSEQVEKGMRLAYGLASQQDGESVLEAIERTTGTRSRISLHEIDDGDSPVVRVPSADDGNAILDDRRYQIVGEIARGGVGVVFRGRDRDLGREVALKVLRKDLAGSPEIVQRFIEEAQIEGQLQHPGVVPVYGLGIQPDGRPYFAMKLIKGETLASLLKSRRKAAEDRRRLLTAFEQVCQTVAYAHARRVVHRDLKPANILVGGFGQVQVVDWGFAKVLPRGGIADEEAPSRTEPEKSLIETVRSGPGSAQSIAGSVLGTPPYMPPEQAVGHVERVNETSDVFALGAILTEILTGLPPYTGEDTREVLRRAAECDTADALVRLEGCDADRELIDLAKRCLSPAQAARPRDAGDLAEVVSTHLAAVEDRAQAARVEAAEARVRVAGERRARRLTLALAVTVMLAIAAGAGGVLLAERAAGEHRERVLSAVGKALAQVVERRGEARAGGLGDISGWSTAEAAAVRAVELARSPDADEESVVRAEALLAAVREEAQETRRRAEVEATRLALVERLEEIRSRRGDEFPIEEKAADYAAALREQGIDPTEQSPAAAAARIREHVAREEIVAILDDWTLTARSERVDAILAVADPDPWRTRVRELAAMGRRAHLQGLARDEELAERPLRSLHLLGDALGHASDVTGAIAVYRTAETKAPYEFWTCFGLGWWSYRAPGSPRGGAVTTVPALTKAAAARPRSVAARFWLGWALGLRDEIDPAIAALREALDLDPDYGAGAVSRALFMCHRGKQRIARLRGDPPGLLRAARATLEVAPAEWVPASHLLVGQALVDLGRYREAETNLRQAMKLGVGIENAIALHQELGYALSGLGQWEEAVPSFRKALELARSRGGDIELRLLQDLGACLLRVGGVEEALALWREALGKAPDSSRYRTWFVGEIGRLLLLGRGPEEAVAFLRPRIGDGGGSLTSSISLYLALRRSGGDAAARSFLKTGIDLLSERVRETGSAARFHGHLGAVLGLERAAAVAIDEYERLVGGAGDPVKRESFLSQLSAVRAQYHLDLSGALEALRPPDGAESGLGTLLSRARLLRLRDGRWPGRQLEEALDVHPADEPLLTVSARAALEEGRFDEAVSLHEQRRMLCRTQCDSCRRSLASARRLAWLSRRIREILRDERVLENVTDRYLAAEACDHMGRDADAVKLYRSALEAGLPTHQASPASSPAMPDILAAILDRAARAAVRAAGRAETQAEGAALRRQALDWMRRRITVLSERRDLLAIRHDDGAPAPTHVVRIRLADDLVRSDLATVRDEEHLSKLPPAEAEAWREHWAAVRKLWERYRW